MRRGRVWGLRVSRGVATVAVGALIGFLVPMVAADLAAQPEVAQEQVSESEVARRFIDAYVVGDKAVLGTLAASAELLNRAAQMKAEYVRVDRPVHLGSWTVSGGATLHAYSAHVIDNAGEDDQLAWRVLTAGGNVAIIDPPGTVGTP